MNKLTYRTGNFFKKGLLFILSFIVGLSSLGLTAYAEDRILGGYAGEWEGSSTRANGTLQVDTSVGWFLGGSSYGQEGHMTINGKTGYCLERQKTYYGGTPYQDMGDNFSSLGISPTQAKKLSLISYFAEQRAKNNVDWIAVAQSLIWAEQGEGKGYVLSPSFPDLSSLQGAMNTLIKDVDNYYVLPSFEGTIQTIKVGETIRLTDTKKVLETFEIVKTDDLVAEIQGNDLVVTGTANALDVASITFKKKIAAQDTGTSILYDAGPGVQKVGSFYITDPNGGNVKFDVEKHGALELVKTNAGGNLLNGAKVRVWNNNGYDQEHSISNGKVTINNLVPGEYSVKETQAPEGYLLNSSTFNVTVEASKTASVTIVDDVPTGTFTLTKTNTNGSSKLENAKFSVWNDSGYYQEFTTNANGQIVVTGLALGRYKYKEIVAPTGYLVDNTEYTFDVVYKDQHTSVVHASATRTNDVPTGTFTLVKTNDDGSSKLENATYRIWNDNGYNQEFTTNAKGQIVVTGLALGRYKYKEIVAPNGYLVDNTEYTFGVLYKDQHTSVIHASATRTNIEPLGKITLNKKDVETGEIAQGNATLKNAEYTLYAKNDIYNKARTKKFYSKDEVVAIRKTNDVGQMNDIDNLPMGSYYLKETVAPIGYVLDKTVYDINIQYANQTTPIIIKNMDLMDTVMKQAFTIVKVSADTPNGIIPTLQGAEFTVKLKSDVEQYGWDSAQLYDVLITDFNGYAKSIELPYGVYVVKETKTPPDVLTARDFEITIDKDSRTPQAWRVINDAPFKAYVQIIKKDIETNKTILIAGAKFKIKNVDTGEYLTQKVGLFDKVDTFTTDKNGRVSTPLMVQAGNFQLEEITAPNGYLLSDIPIPFKITNQGAVNTDPDNDPVVTLEFKDLSVKGQINIKKTNIKNDPLENAVYELYANEDILDPSNDKSILYLKNTLIETLTTNEQGESVSKVLPLGKYLVKEKVAPDHYVLENKEYNVELTYDTQYVSIITHELNVIDKQVAVEKVDVNGNFVEGAKLQILHAKTKQVVDEWETQEESYYPSGLIENETYIVREISTPTGYVTATDIEFTVNEDKDIQLVSMVDKQIIISKQDITGTQELVGAELQVVDMETDEVVDSWVSDGTAHYVSNLLENKMYRLEELYAPDQYVISMPIEFNVTGEKVNQEITMKDKQVAIEKVDVNGNYVSGATLQVLHAKTKQIVDEWETQEESYYPSGLIENETYIVREISTPAGYVTATDIEFTVNEDKDIQLVSMVDKQIIISKQDITGTQELVGAELQVVDMETDEVVDSWVSDGTAHYVSNLLENKMYRLEELYAPNQYVISMPIEFNVTGEKVNQEINIVDKQVAIEKVDVNGNFVEGAKLQILHAKTKQVVDEWTSIGDYHYASGLVEGESYILREIEVPESYVKANDVLFTVSFDKETQTVTMVDYRVSILKIDAYTKKPLKDAKFEVIDVETQEVVDKWTTGLEEHYVENLIEGKEYIIKEIESPQGYLISLDTEIVVDGDKQIIVENVPKIGKVEFNKLGEIYYQENEITETEFGQATKPVWKESNLLGSVITIYAAEDIILGGRTIHLKDEVVTTVESDLESAYSELLFAGKYYAVETTVPHGYLETNKEYPFEIKNDGSSDIKIIPMTIKNERPKVNLNFKKVLEQGIYFNEEAYKEVVFGVFARETIYDYKGDIALNPDQLVQTTGITKDGNLSEHIDLPNGQYYIKELKTHEDYILDLNEYDFVVGYQGKDVFEYQLDINEGNALENDLIRGKIKITKIDSDQKDKKLSGAEFKLFDASFKELELAVSNEEGELFFEMLENGVYYIQETKAPEGYKLQNGYHKIELNNRYNQDNYYELIIDNHKMPSIKVEVTETGDSTNIVMFMSLLIVSLAIIGLISLSKRNKQIYLNHTNTNDRKGS